MQYKRAFTLLEVLVVVIIVGILASLGIINYTPVKERALEKEARSNLQLISAAEKIRRMESNDNTYVACQCNDSVDCNNTTNGCNYLLKLSLVKNEWDYTVTTASSGGATNNTFTATATRKRGVNQNETITLNQSDTWGGTFTP